MLQIRSIHWITVLTLAAALHLGLFLRFYSQRPVVAQDPGAQAITIALAPEPEPEPVAEPKPEPKSEPEPEPEPEPKPEPKPKPKPKPKPEPKPEPRPKPTPQPEPEPVATAVPEPEPAPAPRSTAVPPEPVQRAEQKAPKPLPGATGGITDTPPDYRDQLSAWLERHKNYPRRARRLGQQGTAVLHFVIDRNGKVLEWDLRSSSGHRLLDSAVEDMIQRADPLPAMPESMKVARLELTVPVNFLLR